ncbi:MAG: DUF6455 family protein [Rhizobiaceae bacterium]
MNFERVYLRLDLMDRMMAALGLDGVFARMPQGELARTKAGERCRTCTKGSDCAVWLEDHPVAAEPPHYCRNGTVFSRLVKKFEDGPN